MRLVHTARGLASGLGAVALAQAAEAVEAAESEESSKRAISTKGKVFSGRLPKRLWISANKVLSMPG